VPPKVEYALTPLGRGLTQRIAAIREWAYDNIDDIERARRDFDTQLMSHGDEPAAAAAAS
jgi:DNA-binding HxlR family transcriptional regulator